MSRTVSPSSGKPYGLARVCRVWRASRATIYRHLSSNAAMLRKSASHQGWFSAFVTPRAPGKP